MFRAKLVPTAAGRALLSKAQQGAEMKFTRIKTGSGSLGSTDPDTLTDVITEEAAFQIVSMNRTENQTYIKFVLRNDNTTAYYLREMALMAEDPDAGEIAYMYANDGDNAELIDAAGSTFIEREITLIVTISNVESVTVTISSAAYASKEEFGAHVEDNVRHITAAERIAWNEKVGLGEDGKIPSSYLPETENPSLGDLDGTLSVGHGGTGKTSWVANRLLYASTEKELGQMAFPGTAGSVLRQGTSGAPYWTAITDLTAELGMAKIASGTYSGTGAKSYTDLSTFKSNANKITLPFSPKAVIISENGARGGYSEAVYVMMQSGGVDFGNYTTSGWIVYYVGYLDGAILYAGAFDDSKGLDCAGRTYKWVAIA